MPDDKQLQEEIFHAACELTAPAERAAYLAKACGADNGLKERIENLLRVESAAIKFFEPKAVQPDESLPPSTAYAEAVGTIVGRYKLREKIGEGGCGVVYVAEQLEPVRRFVALKLIKPGMDTKNVLARFEAERQALAMMDHPNIAKVLDAGATTAGRPFFVMELVRGVKITDFCDENHLATRQRLKLFVQVCLAVQHAHQKGVIHRDLKPSNILVTQHDGVPVPRVIDFGIAKAVRDRLTEATIYTELHEFIGTPAYMSPEQAGMSGLDIDTRSDIYSLGVLLYELITGRPPFQTEELLKSGLEKMRRTICETEPVRPSARLSTMLRADLTAVAMNHGAEAPRLIQLTRGDLDWIVMKTLEKDRSRRYETANGLATDVQRHLRNEEVMARPPSQLYRIQKFVRRHRLAVTAIAILASVLLAGITVSSREAVRAMRAERAASRAQARAEVASRNEASLRKEAQTRELAARQNAYAADMSAAFLAEADGNLGLVRKLLAVYRPQPGDYDLRGFEWHYLQKLSRGDQVRTLTGHSDYVNSLAYSPDGTVLATGGSDHVLNFWRPGTGEILGSCVEPYGDVISVAFSGDGRILASGGESCYVRLWDVASRKLLSTISNDLPRVRVAFAGTLLAMADGGSRWGFDGGTVKVWDCAAGREILRLPNAGNRVAFSPDGKTLATANGSGRVQLWEVATGRLTCQFPSKLVRSLAFAPDGHCLAWSADQGDVMLWDFAKETPSRLIEGTGNLVFGVAFSPDSQTLAVADQSHDIVLWNLPARTNSATLRGHGGQVWAVTFSPDGRSLASGSRDTSVMIWNFGTRDPQNVITNIALIENQWVGLPTISADGKYLAAAACDGNIQVWEIATCKVVCRLETKGLPVAFSADGRILFALENQRASVEGWNLATGERISRVVFREPVGTASFSPDLKRLVQSQSDTALCLRNAESGEPLYDLPESVRARNVVFSPNGKALAIVDFDGAARVCDLETRRTIWTAKFKDGVEGFAWSTDGGRFAAGNWDGVIRICSAAGVDLGALNGHKAGITHLAFSTDGQTLASSSDDSTVRLWNLATGRELVSFNFAHKVLFLAFTSEVFMVGDANHELHLWRAAAE